MPERTIAVDPAVLAVLAQVGVTVTGAPVAPPAGPPATLVVRTSDYLATTTFYAVPDEAIDERLRAALDEAPDCFAAPDDAYLESWGSIVRLLAVWDLDGLTATEFHGVMVEDFGDLHDHPDLPDLEEVQALAYGWAPYIVHQVDGDAGRTVEGSSAWLSRDYRAVRRFRQSM